MKKALGSKSVTWVLAAFAIVALGVLSINLINKESMVKAKHEATEHINSFEMASYHITAQARAYIQNGDNKYYEEYSKEIDVDKTISQSAYALRNSELTEYELALVDESENARNTMISMESEAFDNVRAGKIEDSRAILYSAEYIGYQELLMTALSELQGHITKRYDEKIQNTDTIILLLFVTIASAGLIILLMLLYNFYSIKRRFDYIKLLENAAIEISQGNFNFDLSVLEKEADYENLAKSFSEMISRVQGINGEITRIIDNAFNGSVDSGIDEIKYQGGWANILKGLNKLTYNLREKIIDSAPLAYVVVDNGVVADCNHYARDYVGFVFGEAVSDYFQDPLVYEDIDKELSVFNSLTRQSVRLNGEFGEPRRYNLYVTVITHGQKRIRVYWAVDVEERERQSDNEARDQQELAKILESIAAAEKEANQLKSSFLVNMSHEIRTPMNAIIGFSQLALMRRQEQSNIDTYHKINESAKNLLAIINDILDFSKIEAQKLDLVEDTFVLEDILTNAFMVATERLDDKPIEMMLKISPDTPNTLYGDKTRLWQILKNLLDNSAKYTKVGRIVLEVKPNGKKGDRLFLSFIVKDTGMGMSKEQLEKLFVPFLQFHNHMTQTTGGTGLGMPITEQLVKLMGGDLNVISRMDVGTEIEVNVPFKVEEESDTILNSISKENLDNCSALIIADDELSAEIMEQLLKPFNVQTEIAACGKDAEEIIKSYESQGKSFKVIIIDYNLSNENGIDVGKQIISMGVKSKLILVAPHTKKLDEASAKNAGFKEIIFKPFVPSVFVRSLYDTLGVSRGNKKVVKTVFKNAKVLLCEDNLLNQEVAVEMLKLLGVDAVLANNGEEALELLEHEPFDLVLMDILMPVMDGINASRIIRASGKPYSGIKIIAITANVIKEQIVEFKKVGMDDYIAKPINFGDLHDKLLVYLPKERRLGERVISEQVETDFSIEGVDVKTALARFNGNVERYKKALLRFAEDSLQPEPPFEELSKNPEELHRRVHTLKGVAGNIGLTDLFETAKEHNDCVVNHTYTKEQYEKLESQRKECARTIIGSIQPGQNAEFPIERGDELECVVLAKELVRACENSDPIGANRAIGKLKLKKWSAISSETIKTLDNYAGKYLFDEILEIVEKLT